MEDRAQCAVFLLHGLGGSWWSMWPLKKWLEAKGWPRVYLLQQRLDTVTSEDDLARVVEETSAAMEKHACMATDRIVMVGQSMGGIVSNRLHMHGWNIVKAVYIGSPLHGASVLGQLENILPEAVANFLKRPAYDYLKKKSREEPPPHPYTTVSMAWPFTEFDGCVYRKEATFDKKSHIHLPWADHRSVFFNPRLWHVVSNEISC